MPKTLGLFLAGAGGFVLVGWLSWCFSALITNLEGIHKELREINARSDQTVELLDRIARSSDQAVSLQSRH